MVSASLFKFVSIILLQVASALQFAAAFWFADSSLTSQSGLFEGPIISQQDQQQQVTPQADGILALQQLSSASADAKPNESSWTKSNSKSKSASKRQLKLLRGERGPPGPKGDAGPRGDRGPPGPTAGEPLKVFKDRETLLDSTIKEQPRLAFVESEQILVVRTETGWRPVQLLGPLRDFRKTVAKFSKSAVRRQPGNNNLVGEPGVRREKVPTLKAEFVDFNDEQATRKLDTGDDDDDDDEEEDEDDEDEEDGAADDEEDQDDLDEPSIKGTQGSSISPPLTISGRSALIAPVAWSVSSAAPSSATDSNILKLRLVALNEPYSGNIHGIRGADFECRRSAAKAGVKGSFRAFLASNFQNLNDIVRLHSQKYPIVNLRGDTLADSWHDLFRQPARVANPLSRIYSFDGRHVASNSNWPNKLVWHGATNRLGLRDPIQNCDGWHSDSLNKFGLATPIHSPKNSNRKKSLKRRHLNGNISEQQSTKLNQSINGTSATDANFEALDVIEKYPCRMPLIALCIETIGQPAKTNSKFSSNDL